MCHVIMRISDLIYKLLVSLNLKAVNSFKGELIIPIHDY